MLLLVIAASKARSRCSSSYVVMNTARSTTLGMQALWQPTLTNVQCTNMANPLLDPSLNVLLWIPSSRNACHVYSNPSGGLHQTQCSESKGSNTVLRILLPGRLWSMKQICQPARATQHSICVPLGPRPLSDRLRPQALLIQNSTEHLTEHGSQERDQESFVALMILWHPSFMGARLGSGIL